MEEFTYQNDNVYASSDTYLEVRDGAAMISLYPIGNSTVVVTGGLISHDLSPRDNSTVVFSGGSVGAILQGLGNSTIEFSGGTISQSLVAKGNSTVSISGGSIGGSGLYAWDSGMIYLYGSNFSVGNEDLAFGDSLRDYATLQGSYLTGTITGTLQDGSLMNNTFRIREADYANITIVPAPGAFLLGSIGLSLAGWKLRRREES